MRARACVHDATIYKSTAFELTPRKLRQQSGSSGGDGGFGKVAEQCETRNRQFVRPRLFGRRVGSRQRRRRRRRQRRRRRHNMAKSDETRCACAAREAIVVCYFVCCSDSCVRLSVCICALRCGCAMELQQQTSCCRRRRSLVIRLPFLAFLPFAFLRCSVPSDAPPVRALASSQPVSKQAIRNSSSSNNDTAAAANQAQRMRTYNHAHTPITLANACLCLCVAIAFYRSPLRFFAT